jgi:hypothetical protein
VYKGTMLVWGTWLAVRTRKVNMKDMNESKMTGMSLYSLTLLAIVAIPITLLLNANNKSRVNNLNTSFVLIAVVVDLCFLIVLMLMVGSKIWLLYVLKLTTLGEDNATGVAGVVVQRGLSVVSSSGRATTANGNGGGGPGVSTVGATPRATPVGSAASPSSPAASIAASIARSAGSAGGGGPIPPGRMSSARGPSLAQRRLEQQQKDAERKSLSGGGDAAVAGASAAGASAAGASAAGASAAGAGAAAAEATRGPSATRPAAANGVRFEDKSDGAVVEPKVPEAATPEASATPPPASAAASRTPANLDGPTPPPLVRVEDVDLTSEASRE